MNKDGFVPSIKESELKEGQMKPVRVQGQTYLAGAYRRGSLWRIKSFVHTRAALLKRGILKGYTCYVSLSRLEIRCPKWAIPRNQGSNPCMLPLQCRKRKNIC